MQKTFSREVREAIYCAQNGFCCCSEECTEPVTEYHHGLPNTKPNQKRFPLFLQSIFNCYGMNNHCHRERTKTGRIGLKMAEAYEIYLRSIEEGVPL